MPQENLTRDEAIARRAIVSVSSYEVSLTLSRAEGTFHSRTRVRFAATPGASTFIDAITERVHRVALNGLDLDPAQVADGSRIALENLSDENELVVDADMRYMNTGEGLHRFVDPVDGEVYLYTQFEVPDARRVFAVFEQPDLKATFRFIITAPLDWQIVSNQPTPTPSDNGDGTGTWHFSATARISSYITALIAGPYRVTQSTLTSLDGRTIPLGIFARQSLAPYIDAENIFETTRQGFAFFEAKFGVPYPFEKYDQLFVPEFNAGAMENAGAVTFTETYVFRSKVSQAIRERRVVTILHELAHMWFGDLVTMRWWNDLWLNESFAEWASTIATAEATEWREAWTTFAMSEKSWAYRQDQLPSTHPIVANIRDLEDVFVNFDGITYAKGGSVLKQLAAWVGLDAFFAGVGAYFSKHAYSNTELSDLLVELERSSGRDLASWSEVWLETAGVNTLRTNLATDESGIITQFTIEQSAPAEYPTLRPHRLAIGLYEATDSGLSRVDRIELDVDGAHTPVSEMVGRAQPALILLNDDDLAYAKIRLDAESLDTARRKLSRIDRPIARALVWGTLWDATRDAELPAREFVELVLANIGAETQSTTMRTVLAQSQTALMYVDPSIRTETARRLADGFWQLAQAAEPTSDAQFQLVKAFAATAEYSSYLSDVEALLDRSRPLAGLDVDTDLGWELLIALAAAGKADEARIERYLAEDNTANGAQSAAHARAARPDLTSKKRVWSELVERDDAPNAIVRAAALGFVRGPSDVLETFITPYFEMLQSVWSSRTYAIAEKLIEGLYPAGLANAALRDASYTWLAHHQEPAALRRLVIENVAGVDRALAAQRRDAGLLVD